jgi:phosphoribosylglycinamide formyltransferase-1
VVPGDTPEDVARKVHELEYAHFPVVIDALVKKSKQENQPFDN